MNLDLNTNYKAIVGHREIFIRQLSPDSFITHFEPEPERYSEFWLWNFVRSDKHHVSVVAFAGRGNLIHGIVIDRSGIELARFLMRKIDVISFLYLCHILKDSHDWKEQGF